MQIKPLNGRTAIPAAGCAAAQACSFCGDSISACCAASWSRTSPTVGSGAYSADYNCYECEWTKGKTANTQQTHNERTTRTNKQVSYPNTRNRQQRLRPRKKQATKTSCEIYVATNSYKIIAEPAPQDWLGCTVTLSYNR